MPADLHSTLTFVVRTLLRRWMVPSADAGQPQLPSTPIKAAAIPAPRRFRKLRIPARPVVSQRREWILHAVLVLAAVTIVGRLVHVQLICRSQFADRAAKQQISSEPVPGRPGDLLDRHGRLLATTIIVPSLYVCPARLRDIPQLSRDLAVVLQLDAREVRERLQRNADKQFLWIKRRLTDDEVAAVKKLQIPDRVAGFRREFQRHYPQGPLAAHVLGHRDIDGAGQGGLEQELAGELNGKDGVRRFVRDARGFVLDVLEEVTRPPEDGHSITLTIDVLMQMSTEQQLDALMAKHRARGACAIVMNPLNGEVLALASRPTFDPNHPERAPEDAWKNMAISSVFEPGSTFKPMVVAWALDHDSIDRDARFDCERGAYRMGRRVLHDHHRYGVLSLTDVLVKSSNIGMAKIGEQLGNAALYELATAFGFGRRTGIELPGELPGLLRPLDDWTSYSTGSIPMGQELAATPLQMISAHATLANGGVRISPHLVRRVQGDAPVTQPVVVTRVVNEKAARWVVQEPLREVVRRGTGTQAQLPDVEVFGKTGTAQKQAENGKGYSSTRHLSSFVGGASAGNPHLLVLVSVDEPQGSDQYGGSVAAPYVAAILKEGLAIFKDSAPSSPVQLASEPETNDDNGPTPTSVDVPVPDPTPE